MEKSSASEKRPRKSSKRVCTGNTSTPTDAEDATGTDTKAVAEAVVADATKMEDAAKTVATAKDMARADATKADVTERGMEKGMATDAVVDTTRAAAAATDNFR